MRKATLFRLEGCWTTLSLGVGTAFVDRYSADPVTRSVGTMTGGLHRLVSLASKVLPPEGQMQWNAGIPRTPSSLSQDQLKICGQSFAEEIERNINPAVERLRLSASQNGDLVIGVSDWPIELVEAFSNRFVVLMAAKTTWQLSGDGRTVADAHLSGLATPNTLRTFAKDKNIDLIQSAFITGAARDLPLLGMVGYPTLVRPRGQLNDLARLFDWPSLE